MYTVKNVSVISVICISNFIFLLKNINSFSRKNIDTVRKLGEKIRVERLRRKLSQEKLAEHANLNRNFIGMIERAETNVTVKNLEGIANALNSDIKDLFEFIF